ncbi:MAG: ATP synthase subunit I [Candidatus Aminicenantes bacterium]
MNEQLQMDERILRRIPVEIAIVALAAAVGVFFIFGFSAALLVLAGGGTAGIGFIWMRASVDRFLDQSKPRAMKAAVFLYGLRLLLIILIFSIIILFFSQEVLAFAAGFSSIVVVILFEAASALTRHKKKWKP